MTTLPTDFSIKVSVIIPTFNTPPNDLKKTIDSVLDQTESNFELILIDDGSALSFSGVQNDYNDTRVIYLKNDKNLGVAKTRNRGIKIAKAPYIAFLDAGDHWMPQKLEKQIDLISSNTNVAMVFCGARYVTKGAHNYDMFPKRHNDWYSALSTGNPITGSSSAVLIDTAVCKKLGGFYTEKDIPEDRELWLRIAKNHQIDYVNEILVVIELLENSRGSDPFKKEITYWHFIELHSEDMKKKGVYKKSIANYHARIAHLCFLRGLSLKGLKHLFISLFLWPGRSRLVLLYHYLNSKLAGTTYSEQLAKSEFNAGK